MKFKDHLNEAKRYKEWPHPYYPHKKVKVDYGAKSPEADPHDIPPKKIGKVSQEEIKKRIEKIKENPKLSKDTKEKLIKNLKRLLK